MRLWGFLDDHVLNGQRIPAGSIHWGPDSIGVAARVCNLTPLPICGLLNLAIYPPASQSQVFYKPCPECGGRPSGRLTLCADCGGSGKVPA